VQAGREIKPTKTVWFEGPFVPLPDSQQPMDYPRDYAGEVKIAAGAPPGVRYWRVWTAQGAPPPMKFVVADLPEVVEQEIEGAPIPVEVQLPVTVNGRIFPREDLDVWSFKARRGQVISCSVLAASLGSPLDSRLEVLDPHGRRLAENDDGAGSDSFLRFVAPEDGTYQVRIHDINFRGGQAYVYRLTLTADPTVDWVYPLGGRRGSKVEFETGWQGHSRRGTARRETVAVELPKDSRPDHAQRFPIHGKRSQPFLIELDDLPEHLEVEPNDEPARVKPVPLPAILNGRIDHPGDVDFWAFSARKGDVYEFDVRAGRLGSPLAAVFALLDTSGKELARADAVGSGTADPQLTFTVPADGIYVVRLAERFPSRGGPAYAYRLLVRPPRGPDYRLHLGEASLTLNRGGEAKLKVQVERSGGFKGAIRLQVDGLPQGVSASGTLVREEQNATEIVFTDTPAARVGGTSLTIRGTATVAGRPVVRTATLPAERGTAALDSVLLALALPTPFKLKGDASEFDFRWAPKGTVMFRHFRIERGGYSGPLEARIADRQGRFLQGVTGPTLNIPPDVNEFDYPVHFSPSMETARTSRTVVSLVGKVRDADSTEHEVNFSSNEQNCQIIAVIEPERLSVKPDRVSLRAVPGARLTLPVEVLRGKGLQGPATVEVVIPKQTRGLIVDPVTVPADQTRALVHLRFTGDKVGPFNQAVVVQATMMEKGQPVVAAAKVEIVLTH
jgi:hypothetical protein